MTAHAIPTAYGGIAFRSRLEAKWAAFFDLAGWRYEYEPFDRAGWIPDFVLMGPKTLADGLNPHTVLVEVKPVKGMADPLFSRTADEMERAAPGEQALILSYFLPTATESWTSSTAIGWLAEPECAYGHEGRDFFWHWQCAVAGLWHPSVLSFCHEQGGWADRITCLYNGDQGPGGQDEYVKNLWKIATNVVQWGNDSFAHRSLPHVKPQAIAATARA